MRIHEQGLGSNSLSILVGTSSLTEQAGTSGDDPRVIQEYHALWDVCRLLPCSPEDQRAAPGALTCVFEEVDLMLSLLHLLSCVLSEARASANPQCSELRGPNLGSPAPTLAPV